MNIKKIVSNTLGIGLVEVMMGVAISGGLALTIAKMMENANQNTKQNEAKNEGMYLRSIVQNILSNPTACHNTISTYINTANLSTMQTSSVAVANIKDKDNNIVYSPTVSSTVIAPLKINSIELTNYKSSLGTADLLIKVSFQRTSTVTQQVKPLRITLNMNLDPSNNLTSCTLQTAGGEWLLTGNAGTDPAANYVGTSDNQPLIFKVNAIQSGRIDSAGAFFGYRAGLSNSGTSNTAIGTESLYLNSSGNMNTSVGYQSLYQNTTGVANSAFGSSSLRQNNGDGNSAFGVNTMWIHSSGSFNTAIGYTSMQMSSTSTQNTSVGAISLRQITTGSSNTAVGYGVLNQVSTGSNNTAIGHVAGYSVTGSNNIVIGQGAGNLLTTGSNNVVIGKGAPNAVTTQDFKLAIETNTNAAFNSTPLITGDFTSTARYVTINGKLGINTTTPGTPTMPTVAVTSNTVLHVKGGKTIIDQEGWIAIPLGTNWTSCSTATPSYFRDSNGMVHFKGCVQRTGPTTPAGTAPSLFTLPVGYRPSGMHGQLIGRVPKNYSASTTCSFYIVFDNEVDLTANDTAMNTGDKCFITGISFRAEQ